MQMSLEEAIGYVAADELIEASFLFLILQIYIPAKILTFKYMHFILLEISGLVLILLSWNVFV
jgi:hypothetical protein